MSKPVVLVVEDEPMLALELKEDLEAAGYMVPPVVADGDGVMPALIKHKPAVILMDIKLFGYRDGIDAASRLRAFYKTPILYLTSYSYDEVRERLEKTQPAVYLQKPYDPVRLKEVLAELVKA